MTLMRYSEGFYTGRMRAVMRAKAKAKIDTIITKTEREAIMALVMEEEPADPHALFALKHAIDTGVFSISDKDDYYSITNWEYMKTEDRCDYFKNRDDNEYIKVNHFDNNGTRSKVKLPNNRLINIIQRLLILAAWILALFLMIVGGIGLVDQEGANLFLNESGVVKDLINYDDDFIFSWGLIFGGGFVAFIGTKLVNWVFADN